MNSGGRLGVLAALVLPSLAGCMGLPPADPKAKDANIVVIEGNTPWGRQKGLYINLDKGVIPNGGLVVNPDGVVTITITPPYKPPVTPPAP